MRKLTRQQKQFLDEWFEKHKHKLRGFDLIKNFMSYEDFCTLEEMHDTEILYQEAECYLNNKLSKFVSSKISQY